MEYNISFLILIVFLIFKSSLLSRITPEKPHIFNGHFYTFMWWPLPWSFNFVKMKRNKTIWRESVLRRKHSCKKSPVYAIQRNIFSIDPKFMENWYLQKNINKYRSHWLWIIYTTGECDYFLKNLIGYSSLEMFSCIQKT